MSKCLFSRKKTSKMQEGQQKLDMKKFDKYFGEGLDTGDTEMLNMENVWRENLKRNKIPEEGERKL